jgi:hypothetical protein
MWNASDIDRVARSNHPLVRRVPEVSRIRRSIAVAGALAIVLGGCGGDATSVSTSTTTDSSPVLQPRAAVYAASAQRALDGTVFDNLGEERVADLVVGLCQGLGVGAIGPTIDGLEISGGAVDQDILAEVLTIGMAQVCPDRAPVDLASFYVDAVAGTAESAGAQGAFDEGDVVRAGPIVCDALTADAGVEGALLDTIDSLFGVRAGSLDEVIGVIDGDQGLVAGAVVAAATAILCPEYAADVETFMSGL